MVFDIRKRLRLCFRLWCNKEFVGRKVVEVVIIKEVVVVISLVLYKIIYLIGIN